MDEKHIQAVQRGTLWSELLSRLFGEPAGKRVALTADQGEKAEKQEDTATGAVGIAIARSDASLLSSESKKPPRKKALNYLLKAPTTLFQSKMFDEQNLQAAVERLRERKGWVKTSERIEQLGSWVSIRHRLMIPLTWITIRFWRLELPSLTKT